jgi:Uma2 family endonuclease
VDRLTRLFIRRLGDAAVVRVQNPVVLNPTAEPEPDIAVVGPPIERYADAHPGPADTLLVIEVGDTSVEFDREHKLPRYAKAGIAEAWLVNLPAEIIEVRTDPGPDGYRIVRSAGRGEMLRPIMLPGFEIPTDEILG